MAHTHLVLVVDDDRDVVDLFADTLREAGHRVEGALTGTDAVRQVEEGLRPCVVLADVRMPRMDGWDLSRALQDLVPGLPVVLVTSDKLLSIQAPVRDKPYSPDELAAMVRNYCRGEEPRRASA